MLATEAHVEYGPRTGNVGPWERCRLAHVPPRAVELARVQVRLERSAEKPAAVRVVDTAGDVLETWT